MRTQKIVVDSTIIPWIGLEELFKASLPGANITKVILYFENPQGDRVRWAAVREDHADPEAPPMRVMPVKATDYSLTEEEMARLADTTTSMEHYEARKQLAFMMDMVSRYRRAGVDILAFSRRFIINLEGAHSGTYQRRLDHVLKIGLIEEVPGRTHRTARRFCLKMFPVGP